MVAQTQKVLFLRNCYSTILVRSLNHQDCCSGTTGHAKEVEWRQKHCHGGSRVAVVAEWRHITRHSGRHSNRSKDAIGRPKEAQWWYKGGRSIAEIDTQCLPQYAFLRGDQYGRPLCIHSATTALRMPSSCLFWATCERPISSATFVRLFWTCSKLHGDYGVHGEVWTSSVPPLNDQGNLSASRFVPSTTTWSVLCRTREAQRSQPLCKGVLRQSLAPNNRLIQRWFYCLLGPLRTQFWRNWNHNKTCHSENAFKMSLMSGILFGTHWSRVNIPCWFPAPFKACGEHTRSENHLNVPWCTGGPHFVAVFVPPCVIHSSQSGQNRSFIRSQ